MTDAFFAAYAALLERWPSGRESFDLASPYGRTRVHACGPPDAPPLLLLPGGGATSLVWSSLVGPLSLAHRVYAPDLIGDAGHSMAEGRPMRTAADAMGWLNAVLDGLGLKTAHLCGHSYGGWLALTYAMHAPHRVERLSLLDPTDCFAGMRPAYLLHAAPSLLTPSPGRVRSFLRWEIAGLPVDREWLELSALAARLPRPRVVMPKRPAPEALQRVGAPTLVLLAERSRTHDARRLAETARRSLPDAATAVVPDTSHHSLPTGAPEEVAERMLRFHGTSGRRCREANGSDA